MISRSLAGLIFSVSICAGLIGCSEKGKEAGPSPAVENVVEQPAKIVQPQSNGDISDRLISLIGDDNKTALTIEAVKNVFKECAFTMPEGGTFAYTASDCEIKNAEPGRPREAEKLRMTTSAAALEIHQVELDNEDGLVLFKKVGFSKEQVACPAIEADNIPSTGSVLYLIKKDGKTKFVIRENYSSGTGGTGRDTTVFFDKSSADCEYFIKSEGEFDKHHTELGKKVVAAQAAEVQTKTPEELPPKEPVITMFELSKFPVTDKWVKILENTNGVLYYDPESIRKNSPNDTAVYINLLFNRSESNLSKNASLYKTPDDSDLIRSIASRRLLSCNTTYRQCVGEVSYAGAMGKGKPYNYTRACNDEASPTHLDNYETFAKKLDSLACSAKSGIIDTPVLIGHGNICRIWADEEIGSVQMPRDINDIDPPYHSEKTSQELKYKRQRETETRAKQYVTSKGIAFSEIDCIKTY